MPRATYLSLSTRSCHDRTVRMMLSVCRSLSLILLILLLPATAQANRYAGDVFLLRGFADVFSRGLDEIGEKLKTEGIEAQVISHRSWETALRTIIANQEKHGRKPVVLIGHSLGANAVIQIAEELKKRRIRVNYLVTFAATNPQPVPSNVGKATNFYFATDGWGLPLRAGPGFRGQLKNIDFSKSETVGHFNIDEQERLQRQVIDNTKRFIDGKQGS